MFSESGFFDPDKPIRDYTETELHDFLYKEPVKVRINGINLTYEGLVPKIQKSMLSKDVDALQPHIRAFVERAVTFSACPDCGGTRLNEAARSSKIEGISIADACAMQISDLADWVRGLDEPSVAPLLAALRGEPRLVRRDGPRLPQPRPAVRHALGRRGAAHQDDPPPRVVADRRHLRLRRADHRAARPRRRADELAAPAPARQGQHGPRRRARRGGDPDRRPRRRHGPGRRSPRRDRRVRGHGRRPHRVGDGHRPPPRRPAGAEAGAAGAARLDPDPERPAPQPPGRLGRRAARRARRGDRGRRLRQELADPRLPAADRPVGDGHRPVRDPRLTALEPGDLHGHPRPDPDGVREGERRQARPVQRELGGRLPELQRPGQDLHEPRVHGRGRQRVRGVRGPTLHRRRPRVPAAGPEHRRGPGDAGRGGSRASSPRSRSGSCSTAWPTSGSATSRSARSSTRSPAASASG